MLQTSLTNVKHLKPQPPHKRIKIEKKQRGKDDLFTGDMNTDTDELLEDIVIML